MGKARLAQGGGFRIRNGKVIEAYGTQTIDAQKFVEWISKGQGFEVKPSDINTQFSYFTAMLSETKVLKIKYSGNVGYASIGTVSNNTVSYGTELRIDFDYRSAVVVMSSTKFIVFYGYNTTDGSYSSIRLYSVSSNTITQSSIVTQKLQYYAKLTDTKILCELTTYSADYTKVTSYLFICDISTGSIVVGNTLNLGTTSSVFYMDASYITSTYIVVYYTLDSQTVFCLCTISGNTITIVNRNYTLNSRMFACSDMIQLTSGKCLTVLRTSTSGSGGAPVLYLITLSGTTLSAKTLAIPDITVMAAMSISYACHIVAMSASRVACVYMYNNIVYYWIFTISGTTISLYLKTIIEDAYKSNTVQGFARGSNPKYISSRASIVIGTGSSNVATVIKDLMINVFSPLEDIIGGVTKSKLTATTKGKIYVPNV